MVALNFFAHRTIHKQSAIARWIFPGAMLSAFLTGLNDEIVCLYATI
jgi:hypothetical protein